MRKTTFATLITAVAAFTMLGATQEEEEEEEEEEEVMSYESKSPNEGDLRVWYIPQVPMEAYIVSIPRRAQSSDSAYMESAAFILNTVISFSIFEFDNRIKPDYSDACGIDRFEDGEWGAVEEEEYNP